MSVDQGFVKASTNNLPNIDNDMVVTYLVNNAEYISAETRGVKLTRAAKSTYGDDAVGYVQIKREYPLCTIKAKITPEHKVRARPYSVTAIINEEDEDIVSSQCEDCIASAGGCKHAVAFIMWLHNKSQLPSVTSTEYLWKVSKLSKVSRQVEYITCDDFAKKKDKLIPLQKDCLKDVLKLGQGCTGLLYKAFDKKESVLDTISLYQQKLLLKPTNLTSFVKNVSTKMCQTVKDKIQKMTVKQSDSKEWYEVRYGRITASRAYEASRCKTSNGSLVEAILGANILLQTEAINRGKRLEEKVLDAVNRFRKLKLKKCGIFLREEYPMMAASPDAVDDNYSCEIKCPSKEATVKNYLNNEIPTDKCFAQMQMQMYFAKRLKCLFCVASPKFENNGDVKIIEVKFDEKYCSDLLEKCKEFWEKHVFPLL